MYVKIEVSKEDVKKALKFNDVSGQLLMSEILRAIGNANDGKQRKKRLKALGFDLSTKHRVKCSQCNATAVNGTACHEHGCKNVVDQE